MHTKCTNPKETIQFKTVQNFIQHPLLAIETIDKPADNNIGSSFSRTIDKILVATTRATFFWRKKYK